MTQPEGDLRAAIVQDAETGRVLMLAWIDLEAERRTRESGEAWFWSRSRQEYWHKGATSGNTMAVEAQERGAGEILLTSIDADGTQEGYDLEITSAVADAVSIPVIASGGAGGARHVADALEVAQAALLASILHEDPDRLTSLREELREMGVPIRDAA